MTQLSDLYNARIMELAAAIPRTKRLTVPVAGGQAATATAHSKLCGSTITVDLVLVDGRVADFGQNVRACLLGQASASVVGRELIGTTPAEFAAIATAMRAMLRDGSAQPTGRWADLAVLEPVRAVKARHASTLLVFEAVEKALAAIVMTTAEPAAAVP
jgi:NifU-like protein involved in Fe-S cluster formation